MHKDCIIHLASSIIITHKSVHSYITHRAQYLLGVLDELEQASSAQTFAFTRVNFKLEVVNRAKRCLASISQHSYLSTGSGAHIHTSSECFLSLALYAIQLPRLLTLLSHLLQ